MFKAFVLNEANGVRFGTVEQMDESQLPSGEVTIRVAYSSVNFKDALAAQTNSEIVKQLPFIPGIDLAGMVEHCTDGTFTPGDPVLVTGYDLGVKHFGGFSQLARVPSAWVVPLPEGLSMPEAMAIGTAGFTAALSLFKLESHGLTPDSGPVLVTGATGGVGSVAVSLLSKLGYTVTASTGKRDEAGYLSTLGADSVIPRSELNYEEGRPMRKELWAAAVDPVAGESLVRILSSIRYGGAVAVSGLTGGAHIPASVYPFILRGVSLLGIDSVFCGMNTRKELWRRLAGEWKPESYLGLGYREIGLEQLPEALEHIRKGTLRGRIIVNPS